jgi:hypothetical protein
MPATVHIDVEHQIGFLTFTGTLTDADMLVVQEKIRADPRFQPHFHRLADMRGVDKVELTVEGVRRLAEKNIAGEGSKRAVVAGQALLYGFSRMYEMLTDNGVTDTRVFTDMDEARKWLGLD